MKMARSIEVSAKTIDTAIEKGLEEMGLERENVSVEVLEQPKSGFLGIGASDAKIRMTEVDENGEVIDDEPAPAECACTCECENEGAGFAVEFIQNVLNYICDGAKVEAHAGKDGFTNIEIVGDKLGGIIGRRGETLDAIQHIANLVANKSSGERVRISLDAENYRAKRAESLEKFAHHAAAQACKYKRNKVLEPMNAYERHIVHTTLQDMENIATSSVGTEPTRRVVISYTGPDARRSNNRRER